MPARPDAPSDAPLLAAARLGDADAIAELYSRHFATMTVVARRHAYRDFPAQDLVSEAFARMLQALVNGHGPADKAMPYLAVSMRNLAARHGRRLSHQHAPSLARDEMLHGVPDPRPAPDHGLLVGETRRQLREALDALPPHWREVLLLTHVEELSLAETSRRLGITPQACAALSYRARRALRAAYVSETRVLEDAVVA